jgi:hypothetical protein
MTVKVVAGLFTNLSNINIMTKAHSQDRTSSEATAKFWNRGCRKIRCACFKQAGDCAKKSCGFLA